MLIIISPTKQMKANERIKPETQVSFPEESTQILNTLKNLSLLELQQNMKVNEKIATENLKRYQELKLDGNGSSALFTYQGLQFKYMDIQTKEEIQYLQDHLRILSGLYGVVRPLDSIYPYRLEMQAKIAVNESDDIYAFWNHELGDALLEEVKTHGVPMILNMASKEYEKAVLPYLPEESYINLTFKIRKQGKLKIESTQVKMARGRMIHYLASKQIQTLSEVQQFDEDGYQFIPSLSTKQEYVFVKEASL